MKHDILCALSGGGFRASFFHAGVLRALVRLGLKQNIKVISSVSGGSITNALFGICFDRIITVNDYDDLVLRPLVEFSNINPRSLLFRHRIKSTLIAGTASMTGFGNLFASFTNKLNSELFMEKLDEYLFKGYSLADFSKNVRIVINSTNLNNGARFRFDNHDFGDYKLGYSREIHTVPISQAVMASACYPGLFSPLQFKSGRHKFYLRDKLKRDTGILTHVSDSIHLADGGIYDNLGYYSIKSEIDRGRQGFVLISDASNHFANNNKEYSITNSLLRISDILMEQVTNRDRASIMHKLDSGDWLGSYFKLENSCRWYREYEHERASKADEVPKLGWSDSVASRIAHIRTDLDTFSEQEVKCLVYHGETIVETVLAKWHNAEYKSMLLNPNYQPPAKPLDTETCALEDLKQSHKVRLLP